MLSGWPVLAAHYPGFPPTLLQEFFWMLRLPDALFSTPPWLHVLSSIMAYWEMSAPLSLDCVTLCGQSNFAAVNKLRILRWGKYPGFSRWCRWNLSIFIKERRRQESQRRECDRGSRGGSDAMTGWEPQTKEWGQPLEKIWSEILP